jgi:hypothetical protein
MGFLDLFTEMIKVYDDMVKTKTRQQPIITTITASYTILHIINEQLLLLV